MVFYLIFLSIMVSLQSLEIYVVFPEKSLCDSCDGDGSKQKPFTDLYHAFQAGVFQANQNKDSMINFYLLVNDVLTGYFLPNYTLYNGNGSPFEEYDGLKNAILIYRHIFNVF